ncbi:protein rolling stone-like [Choristoneura fumiferana]|uniref:protein rolling stone-like n=1 Tax=Choristoneura fumiferana TaxID=7141 RepID=UPI003D157B97
MFKRMHKISCSDFWVLSHERLSDFYTSAWQRRGSPLPLLFFRLVLAAASVGFLVWSLTSGQSGLSPLWLIYLTNWGLVMVTAMAVSGFFVSAMIACKRPADDEKTPWYVGLFWIIFNVTQTIAIAITVLYWTLLYDANTMVYATTAAFWLDVAVHGFNSVISVGELVISRTPVRWLHVYQPLLVAAVYVAFSGIYYATDGTNGFGEPFIYPVLNWNEPGMAGAVSGGSLLGVFVVHTLVWALALGRNKLSDILFQRQTHELPHTHDKA